MKFRPLSLGDPAYVARLTPPAINPDSFSGLVRWWAADSLVPIPDNTHITAHWVDQKNGDNADTGSEGGGGNNLYRTNAFGSKPGIDGVDFQYTTFAFGDFTVVSVAKISADTYMIGHATLNHQVRVSRSGANNLSFFSGSGVEVISNNMTNPRTDARCMVWRRSGVNVSFRENKTVLGNTNGNTNGTSFTPNRIGFSSNGGWPGGGRLGEILIYSAAVSDANLDSLYDNYLKGRWGLP